MTGSYDGELGWVALQSLLSQADVAAISHGCERLLLAPLEERCAGDKVSAGTLHLFELDRRIAEVATLLTNSSLVAMVEEIIGPKWITEQVSYRCPQPQFGGQLLHADSTPQTSADAVATCATMIVPLIEFTETNGATRVVPGSHRRPDLQRESGRLEQLDNEQLLLGPPGIGFVFSGHLLHSGTTNNSTASRPALQVTWRVAH